MEHATRLSGHRGEVLCVHAPGDGRLASGGADGSVRVWDLAASRAVRALLVPGAEGVNAVCAGAAGAASHWVYAAAATHVYGWDLRAPGVIVREPACAFNNLASDEIGHIALHEASGALAVADDAGDVHIVDVGSMAAEPGATSGAIVPLRGVHTSICTWVAFRPGVSGRSECCTAGLDALGVRWDWRLAAKLEAWPLVVPGSPFAATLAAAGDAQSPMLQQPQDPLQPAPPSNGEGETSSAAAAASMPSAQMLNPRHAHCVSFTPDGGCVAFALGDGSVEVRLAESGEPICAVDAHRAACSQAHFAPALTAACALHAAGAADDGSAAGGVPLITAGDDRRVRVWSVEGVVGRGATAFDAKRMRHAAESACAQAGSSTDAMQEDGDRNDDDFGEPGFRALGGVRLREKPNGVAAAADPAGSGRAVICVATTGDAIEVLSI